MNVGAFNVVSEVSYAVFISFFVVVVVYFVIFCFVNIPQIVYISYNCFRNWYIGFYYLLGGDFICKCVSTDSPFSNVLLGN